MYDLHVQFSSGGARTLVFNDEVVAIPEIIHVEIFHDRLQLIDFLDKYMEKSTKPTYFVVFPAEYYANVSASIDNAWELLATGKAVIWRYHPNQRKMVSYLTVGELSVHMAQHSSRFHDFVDNTFRQIQGIGGVDSRFMQVSSPVDNIAMLSFWPFEHHPEDSV